MADPQAMTTAGLQAKVSLRRAWFEAHPNQPMPEGRAEVEKLFAAIETEARLAAIPAKPDDGERLREAVIADPWSFNRGPLRERLEWCRMQHQVAVDLGKQGIVPVPRTAEANARWHQDCADWYAEMVVQFDALAEPQP